MTTTAEQLARRANDAFKNTAGFIHCEPHSTPPSGLEFHFTNGSDAERFKLAREIESGSGKLSIDPSNPTVVVNERPAQDPVQVPPALTPPNTPPTQNPTPSKDRGQNPATTAVANPQPTSRFYPTFFLCLFLGVFGVHRFYNGQVKSGIIQLVTFGGCGLWWLVDMVMILIGKFRDKTGASIPNINPKMSWAVFIIILIIGIAGGSLENGSSSGGVGRSSGSGARSGTGAKSGLAVLDGVTYVGDAASRKVMGVSMVGRYKLKFSKAADGKMKCSLTLTIHDGLRGWGQPEVMELKGLTFETGQGLNHDEVVIIRADRGTVLAPGNIAAGQVPDSLTLDDVDLENYEVKLTKVASSTKAKGDSGQAQVKIAPTVLMPRQRFEEIIGKPVATSEQIGKDFADAFGFSLWGFIGMLRTDQFALPEEKKDPIQQLCQANYKRIQAAFNLKYETPWMPELVGDLSKYGVSNFDPGVWQSDMIYHLWLLTRKEGITTNLVFTEYATSNSKIRAFYVEDRLFLMAEYLPARVPSSDWPDWLNRFSQIEGGAPLLVRKNIGLPKNPTPPPDDPMDLYNSLLASADERGMHVSVLGTNYFGQLVSSQARYSSSYALQLVIGDASFFYPLAIKSTEERWKHRMQSDAQFNANRDELMRQIRPR